MTRVGRAIAAAAILASILSATACRAPWSVSQGRPSPGSVLVRYYGHSMVSVADRLHTVVVDPLAPHVGFPVPKLEADLVLISRHRLDLDNVGAVGGSPRVFDQPGVFVLGDVRVIGIPSDVTRTPEQGLNVIYRWSMEGIDIAHLGDLDQLKLTDQQEALLMRVDVMFVPVGGKFTLDATEAVALVRLLEPKVVIPIHYRTGPSTMAIAYADPFLRQAGRVRRAPSSLVVTRKGLPKATEVWLMDWRR